MKKALLIFSNHRVAEKIWPIIPELSKNFVLDLFLVGLFSSETKWVGDVDERLLCINKYQKYFNSIINGPGVDFHGDNITKDLSTFIKAEEYSFVIFDDNRPVSEFNIPLLYKKFSQLGIPVIGNSHGNENSIGSYYNVAYDRRMVLGEKELNADRLGIIGGIPSNDSLKKIKKKRNHILVITNFLPLHTAGSNLFPITFDDNFVKSSGLLELQQNFGLPIVVKLKTRLDDPDYQKNEEYVRGLLDCKIVSNCPNIDNLIGDSAIVISAPSTLCFKPIQLGIPTVMFKGAGAIGNFYDYSGLIDMDKNKTANEINLQYKRGKDKKFISETISGGCDFNSTEVYIDNLMNFIKKP